MVVVLKLASDPRGLGSNSSSSNDVQAVPYPWDANLFTANGTNPTRELTPNGFSAILACYPVAAELASFLDLNTLHSLSRTCHSIRIQLLLHRRQLMAKTLRCSNEAFDPPAVRNGAASSRYQSWDVSGSHGVSSIRITSGKVGPCARDMVGECRRCSRIVCRNCIMKAPSTPMLPNRHRRLCAPCGKADLPTLLGSKPANPKASAFSLVELPALTRESCSCPEEVFVCQPCGHAISSADVNYRRIWGWRSKYGSQLGGLTGIGEGNEGVQCGRDDLCLAARETEVEIDCRSEDLAEVDWVPVDGESGEGQVSEAVGEAGERAGYLRQEIEGIGGVVRTKFKRRVRVGMSVEEHEGERAADSYLAREISGQARSWCGWCNRVILSRCDEDALCAEA